MKRALLVLFALVCALSFGALAEDAPPSRLVYLYVPACSSCAKAEALIRSLGDAVEVRNGEGRTMLSPLVVEKVDLSRDPDRAQALFARYETPESDRIAPSVYFGGHYLAGAGAILSELPGALAEGKAQESLLIDQAPQSPAASENHPGLGAVIGAGLVAGLNPCALSMLILLLGSILHLGRRAAALAAVFLAAKLVTYFLIGFFLLRLLQVWNPLWLTQALKWLLSVAALVLIVLNLLDALRAARGEYGKVKNQLPSRMRSKLQGHIRKLADSPHLPAAMALLGLGISMGEFLCAGQVYLAGLLSWVSTGAKDAQKVLTLLMYCFSFILPSVLITAAVLRLRHTLQVSDWMRRRMPLVKLLSAAVLLAAVLCAWLA